MRATPLLVGCLAGMLYSLASVALMAACGLVVGWRFGMSSATATPRIGLTR